MNVLEKIDSGEWPPPDDWHECLAQGIEWQACFMCDAGWCWDRGGWDPVEGTATHWRTLPPDPAEQPTDGGIGARNVGRPRETQEDFRQRYAELFERVTTAMGSIDAQLTRMPTEGAAEPADAERLENLLRVLEAAQSVMEVGS